MRKQFGIFENPGGPRSYFVLLVCCLLVWFVCPGADAAVFLYYYWFVCSVFSLTSGTNTLPYFNNKHNRPFPSSLVPLFQNESKSETFHMKMSSTCSFILMQIKVIFITMVSHLDSL